MLILLHTLFGYQVLIWFCTSRLQELPLRSWRNSKLSQAWSFSTTVWKVGKGFNSPYVRIAKILTCPDFATRLRVCDLVLLYCLGGAFSR